MHRAAAPNNRYKPAALREIARKNTGNSMYLLIGVAYSPVRILSWLKWHRIFGRGPSRRIFPIYFAQLPIVYRGARSFAITPTIALLTNIRY